MIRILGAGVMGLTIATELCARGHRVELVDPNPDPGPHGCSWWAGGMLAPHCEAASAEATVERHGVQSLQWWQRHTGMVATNGTLVVAPARDRSELDRFARRSHAHRVLDDKGIADLEPDLAGRFSRGLYYPTEGHLAPRAALGALHDRLRQNGVAFHKCAPDTPVAFTIDARGLAARDQLPDLRGVRGEMVVLRCPDITLSRPVRLLHPRFPLYVVPRGDGVFMLGATSIESDRRGAVSLRSLMELLSAAWTLHPAFGEAEVIEIGADARPAFSDNLPKLRRRGDILYANGLYRHGFLLSPAMAQMAADHIERGVVPEFMDECT